jgi:hypothetical protein
MIGFMLFFRVGFGGGQSLSRDVTAARVVREDEVSAPDADGRRRGDDCDRCGCE